MSWLRRLPVRTRVTAAFAAVMVVLLAGVAALVYLTVSASLLDEIDSGLRFRAAAVLADPRVNTRTAPDPALQEPREAFTQIVTRSGTVVGSTPGVGEGRSILSQPQLASLRRPTFFVRRVAGVADGTRLLAIPRPGSEQVLVVGGTMADRTDALRALALTLGGGSAAAIAFACVAAWVVAGFALRPVEQIRQQAAAISASSAERRLDLPTSRDELYRLTVTLNSMLDRLDRAIESERQLLETASHEVRTPLAALKAELELAQLASRTEPELRAAVASAAEETDRLARLADDLLLLARARDDRLPVVRRRVDLRTFVPDAVAAFTARARSRNQMLTAATDDATVQIDPIRVRQLLNNLLDNALRYAPLRGNVTVAVRVAGDDVILTIEDDGPGLSPSASMQGGLGLRIARAVAGGHDGGLNVGASALGGARVEATLRGVRPVVYADSAAELPQLLWP